MRGGAPQVTDQLVDALLEMAPGGTARLVYVDGVCSGVLFSVESPTGDTGRSITVWSQGQSDGGMAFGGWHGHFELDPKGVEAALLWVRSVLQDEVVLAVAEDFEELVDLRDPDSVLDLLTEPWSPPGVALKSWTGARDGTA